MNTKMTNFLLTNLLVFGFPLLLIAQLETVQFTANGANVQTWTVPARVHEVIITAVGADGGSNINYKRYGTTGSTSVGRFKVNSGETLDIVVGLVGTASRTYYSGGGGGGTGVRIGSKLLLVAGGGGGGGFRVLDGMLTSDLTSNGADGSGASGGTGGINGNGGTGGTYPLQAGGGGGGGYLSNGTNGTGANGGIGGFTGSGGTGNFGGAGGFGVGGGGGPAQGYGGGGGGGYNGGGGGGNNGNGGYGGSYIHSDAENTIITIGTENAINANNGSVMISYVQQAVTEQGSPIPTMSEWGLLIFGLLMLNLGVFFIKQKETLLRN